MLPVNVALLSTERAMPKSITLDCPRRSMKMFSGFKSRWTMPCADCFAAALAQARKATLVTSDKDFERAGTGLKILWV